MRGWCWCIGRKDTAQDAILAEGFRGATGANPTGQGEAIGVSRFGDWNCPWDRRIPSFGRHSGVLRAREIRESLE